MEESIGKYHEKCKDWSSSREKTNGLWGEIREIVNKKSVTKKEIKLKKNGTVSSGR